MRIGQVGLLAQQTWRDAFKVYKHPRVIGMLYLGFSDYAPLSIDYGYSL